MMPILFTHELVGSHLFNVNIEQSDIDYFIINNTSRRYDSIENKIHKIIWSVDEGLDELLCMLKYFNFELCVGFGEKQINNSLVEYIEKNKEKFKYQNIGNSFESFIKYESLTKKNLFGQQLYNCSPKLQMYFILYKYIFIKYSQNRNLEECIHLPEEIRQFLIATRKHEILYQEVLNFELPLRREMDKVKSFYADRFNEDYAAREKEKMKLIIQNLEKENF